MKQWNMLTLVGKDQKGIVARISTALFDAGANLGEASMMRLGGNFTIMLMVKSDQNLTVLCEAVKPVVDSLNLTYHFQEIDAELYSHQVPDTRIVVYGADHSGIVAKVTSALLETGFNILDLESDLAGTEEKPIYIMQIEGISDMDIPDIEAALSDLKQQVRIDVYAIETLIG